MLDELPETLDETYERMLRNIHKANRDHAHRLLQCLTVAIRPLRVTELAEVLAIDFGTAASGGTSKLNPNWRWEDQQQAVLSTCSSLISVVDQEGPQVVQFSHFSVKEFLTSPRLASSNSDVSRFHIHLEPAHTILAKACLGVLLRLNNDLLDGYDFEDNFPLAEYAAEHWIDHAQFRDVSLRVLEGMEELFDPMKPFFAAWIQLHDIDTEPSAESTFFWFAVEPSKRFPALVPLYYAALCGFHDLAEHLIINHPEHVNANCGFYVSPLGAALGARHFKVAQLLYQHGADVDIRGYGKRTLLCVASYGHRGIVEWLLHRGADPNIGGQTGWTPLHFATAFGRTEIAEILLQYKAVVNAQDDAGRTPLHLVSKWEHVDFTRLLLEHGADVNSKDVDRCTPLHLAYDRMLDIARLLVGYGANLDLEDYKGRTVSQVASERGHHDFAKWLSDLVPNENTVDLSIYAPLWVP
jgi:ankyrin repeat protein